jgi:hypothetical protein
MVDDEGRIDWRLTAIHAMAPTIAARVVEARRERARAVAGRCKMQSQPLMATSDSYRSICDIPPLFCYYNQRSWGTATSASAEAMQCAPHGVLDALDAERRAKVQQWANDAITRVDAEEFERAE